jgi:streptogramin lyase
MRLTLKLAGVAAAALLSTATSASASPTLSSYWLAVQPVEVAPGPDGALWLTEPGFNSIGRVTTGGARSTVAIPTASASPNGITAGPDGNVWFTELNGNKIGKLTPGATTPSEYAVPTASAKPYDIARGPDGNLWFTEQASGKVGKVALGGASPVVSEVTSLAASSQPSGIVAGPDGNLWFTEYGANKVGRLTTGGTLTEFATGAGPRQIIAGPDGALWFTERGANKIGRITTAGAVTEFAAPTSSQPDYLAVGPDGNVWFTESGAGRIGEINASGSVADYALPGFSAPEGLAEGPDNRLWIADSGTFSVVAAALPPAVSTLPPTGVDTGNAVVSGVVSAYGQATSVHFEYGPTTTYGSATPASALSPSAAGAPVSANLSGLSPSTTYHYRVVATSAGGTAVGPDETLRTADAPQPRVNPVATATVTVPSVVRVGANGVVNVPIYCPATAVGGCSGTLTVALVQPGKGRAHARLVVSARCGRGCRPLGSSHYHVPAGRHGSGRVSLTSWGRHLLARMGALPVKVTTTSAAGAKTYRTVLRHVTARPHKRPKGGKR